MAPVATRSGIGSLPYPDFVALLRQENSPPGGGVTLNYWRQAGDLQRASNVLDLACSTAYCARTLAGALGCSVVGVDVALPCLQVARDLAGKSQTASRPLFVQARAEQLPFADGTFTHVIAGSTFGFIQEREAALREVSRVLHSRGRLLVSVYHYATTPPLRISAQVERAIGYRPDPQRTLAFWKRFFRSNFAIIDCWEFQLGVDPQSKIEAAVRQQVRRANALAPAEQAEAERRLLRIRSVLNEHRKYQGVAAMCLERR